LLSKPLSLRERGWGEGTTLGHVDAGLQHCIHSSQNIVVPEAEDVQTLSFKKPGSNLVNALIVLRSIQFNHQASGLAVGIHDVGWNGVLAAEFHVP